MRRLRAKAAVRRTCTRLFVMLYMTLSANHAKKSPPSLAVSTQDIGTLREPAGQLTSSHSSTASSSMQVGSKAASEGFVDDSSGERPMWSGPLRMARAGRGTMRPTRSGVTGARSAPASGSASSASMVQ